jgi:hypothetical protein
MWKGVDALERDMLRLMQGPPLRQSVAGLELVVRPSLLPGAGLGLFTERPIAAGQVVARGEDALMCACNDPCLDLQSLLQHCVRCYSACRVRVFSSDGVLLKRGAAGSRAASRALFVLLGREATRAGQRGGRTDRTISCQA